MVYSEELAQRIRKNLSPFKKHVEEKKMMGGLTFMLHGKMCCGVVKNDMMVRIGPEGYAEALGQPHARAMDFTGRPLRGFVFVGPRGYKTDEDLANWVNQATEFVSSLPVRSKERRDFSEEDTPTEHVKAKDQSKLEV